MLKFLFFLLFNTLSFSQTHTIIGLVSDDSNKPLKSANVIAKTLQEKASLKFAIADNKRRYRLKINKEVKNEITISYRDFVMGILLWSPIQSL